MTKKILIGGAVILIVVFVLFGILKNNQTTTDVEPVGDAAATHLYDQALVMKKNGEFVNAQNVYQKIIAQYPDHDNIATIQKELENLNMQIIFSNTPTSKTSIHEVKSGDSLGKLAQKYKTTIELIKISNNLKSDIIRIGQKLRIWTGTFNIFIDKSQNILILKVEDEIIKVYSVSTGENNSTPVGDFKIVIKLVDPVWFNRGVVVPPESPQNVLGSRWLGFDLPGYGIHGTIKPEAIGSQVTAGCIRMRNEDVEEVYSIIPTGTKIIVTN